MLGSGEIASIVCASSVSSIIREVLVGKIQVQENENGLGPWGKGKGKGKR